VNQAELTEKYFELVGYMVTSARNLLEETPLYGPFRLVDATSRLIAILEAEGLADRGLLSVREQIDASKYSVMDDPAKFRAFLDDLVDTVVNHMKPLEGRR
jgi:hypothetical protein